MNHDTRNHNLKTPITQGAFFQQYKNIGLSGIVLIITLGNPKATRAWSAAIAGATFDPRTAGQVAKRT